MSDTITAAIISEFNNGNITININGQDFGALFALLKTQLLAVANDFGLSYSEIVSMLVHQPEFTDAQRKSPTIPS